MYINKTINKCNAYVVHNILPCFIYITFGNVDWDRVGNWLVVVLCRLCEPIAKLFKQS